jgi:hypothetical protein
MGVERSLSLLFDRDDISMLSASGQSLWGWCDAKPDYELITPEAIVPCGLGLDASDNFGLGEMRYAGLEQCCLTELTTFSKEVAALPSVFQLYFSSFLTQRH